MSNEYFRSKIFSTDYFFPLTAFPAPAPELGLGLGLELELECELLIVEVLGEDVPFEEVAEAFFLSSRLTVCITEPISSRTSSLMSFLSLK